MVFDPVGDQVSGNSSSASATGSRQQSPVRSNRDRTEIHVPSHSATTRPTNGELDHCDGKAVAIERIRRDRAALQVNGRFPALRRPDHRITAPIILQFDASIDRTGDIGRAQVRRRNRQSA